MMIGAMRIRYFHRGILGGLVELPHKSGANLAYVAIDGVPAPTMQFDLPSRQADLDAVTAFCTYAREVGCIQTQNDMRRCLGFAIVTDPARFKAPRSDSVSS